MDTICFDLKTYQITLLLIVVNRANTTQSTILHWQDSGKPNSNKFEFIFLCKIICLSIRNGYVRYFDRPRPSINQSPTIKLYSSLLYLQSPSTLCWTLIAHVNTHAMAKVWKNPIEVCLPSIMYKYAINRDSSYSVWKIFVDRLVSKINICLRIHSHLISICGKLGLLYLLHLHFIYFHEMD